jgi:ATP-binding cassette subfamily C protein
MIRLRIAAAADASLIGRELELPAAGEAWIGREAGCELVVADNSVSRRHAQLTVRDGKLLVRDNKSANGLLVGGQRVAEATVAPGGSFSLGAVTLQVLAEAQAPLGADRTMMISRIIDIAAQLERPRPLLEQGERVQALANQPFLIDDPMALWVVESGKVEIFTVRVEAGAPVGSRTHFLSVEPGGGFFGLDSDRYGHESGFLAAGKAGSVLRRFDLDDLQLLATVPAHRDPIVAWVDGWLRAVSKRLSAALSDVPTPGTLLVPGEAAVLEAGKAAASVGSAVVWIEMPAAFFLYDGATGISAELEGLLFPLAPGGCLELLDGAEKVTPAATADCVRDARMWAGLDAFHRVVCESELLNRQLAVADEVMRLERKQVQARSARQAGIGAIEAVLGGTRAWSRPELGGGDAGPVLRVCRELGRAMGLDVMPPVGIELDDLTFDEKVLAIAAASHFRARKIALADAWWASDHGPLLAQREGDGAPLALLPTRPGAYEVVDGTGARRRLTARLAEAVAPFAYCFYRPVPDGKLSAGQLVRYSVGGLEREFRAVALAGIAVGMLGTFVPTITGKVFDTAIPGAERGALLQFCLGLFLVAFATAAFKVTQNVAMLRVQSRMDYSAQAAVWDRLLNLPVTFFRRFSAGDLSDRAAAIDKMRGIVAGTGVAALLGTFASLFNAVQMCFYSFALAGVAIGLTLTYVLLTTGCNYLKLRLQRAELQQRGRLNGMVLQLIRGVPKLRVSGTEPHAFRVWATDFAAMRRTAFRVGRVGNFIPVLNGGFPVLSSLVIFATVVTLFAKAAEKGEVFELSTGDFLAFSSAFGIFLGAMQALGDASVSLLNVVPVYERLKPILQEEPEVDRSKQPPAKLRGAIEISHVFFRYGADSPHVLRDVSLKIEPGEFVALVGGSGSGKSTLLKIMLGFERPEKGAVYYDGQDLSTLDVRLLRQQLGVVLQESRLLPADIFRNIVGSSARTIAEAWEAARKAGLDEDIKRMPMGMHTYVSEGGGGFSGGQKQRLMIARALVHKPKVLFLDEATSALDNRTQTIVTESMSRLQATRIVIAHRLSTIVDADRICYLEQGVIAEMGSYQELMAKNGLFAQLAKRQLA